MYFFNAKSFTSTTITDQELSDLIQKVSGFVTLIFYVIRFFIETYNRFVADDQLLQHDDGDVNVDKSTCGRGYQRLKMYLM